MSNVYNSVEDHCLRAMKIVHHHANCRLDWLISGHQSVNSSRVVISILSGKYKGFTFVHPVHAGEMVYPGLCVELNILTNIVQVVF